MKIVLPNLPFPYIQGLASALKTLEESCDMQILEPREALDGCVG